MSNDDDFNFELDPSSPEDVASPSDLEATAAPDTAEPATDKKSKKDKKGKDKKKKSKPAKAKKKTKQKAKAKKTKRKKAKPARDESKPKIPQFNTYTSMLLISLICLAVACALLYLEATRYGSFPMWKTDGLGG